MNSDTEIVDADAFARSGVHSVDQGIHIDHIIAKRDPQTGQFLGHSPLMAFCAIYAGKDGPEIAGSLIDIEAMPFFLAKMVSAAFITFANRLLEAYPEALRTAAEDQSMRENLSVVNGEEPGHAEDPGEETTGDSEASGVRAEAHP